MLVSRLLRSLLRFLTPGIAPEEGGGAPAPEPVAAPPATPAAEPTPVPAAEPVAAAPAAPAVDEPADPFAGLKSALETLGNAPNGDPPGGQPRDANGRFLPVAAATPAPPAAAPGAQPPAAAAPAGQTPPAPRPGEVDLTPPEGLQPRAQERWAQLTERAKLVPVLEQRAAEATQALDSVRRMVGESGLAPQEFTEMLTMGRLYKSANPQDAQQALRMLDGLRTELAQRLGVEVPGFDPLSQHPDLQADVNGMLMTRERALEIAQLRGQSRQARGQLDAIGQHQREQTQHAQAVQHATQRMDAALAARNGTPGHAEKLAYVRQHLANPQNMQRFVQTYQPQQWEAAVMMMYDAFTPQPAQPAAPAAPQPLRPAAVAPGARVASGPVTAESAVRNAFASAGL